MTGPAISLTLAEKIVECHLTNPDWIATEIARHLECSREYVRVIKQRRNLAIPAAPFPSFVGGRIAAEAFQLGHAARRAGMTIADIEAWAEERGVKQYKVYPRRRHLAAASP